MIIRIAVSFVLLLSLQGSGFGAAAAPNWDEPTEFRGMKWGISESEATGAIKAQWQKRREAGQIVVYTDIAKRHQEPKRFTLSYRDKIGEVSTFFVLHFLDDRFVYASMSFETKDFGHVRAAFIERHGAPTTSKTDYLQTPLGARYEGVNLQWIGRSVWIQLKQYGLTITHGTADIGKMEFLEYLTGSQRQKDWNASKDL